MIRVLLADDQALIRAGFHVLIDAAGDLEVVGEATDGAQAVDLARRERADYRGCGHKRVLDRRLPRGVRASSCSARRGEGLLGAKPRTPARSLAACRSVRR